MKREIEFENLFNELFKIREAYKKRKAFKIKEFVNELKETFSHGTAQWQFELSGESSYARENRAKLVSIARKYDITINIYGGTEGVGRESILGGETNDYNNKLTIDVNTYFLYGFYKNKLSDQILYELDDIAYHEDTHVQQNVNSNGKSGKDYIQLEDDQSNLDEYMTQNQETDAYARQIASEIIRKNINPKDAIKQIINDEVSFDKKWMVEKYYSFRKSNRKMWKRFLRRIYEFISSEEMSDSQSQI